MFLLVSCRRGYDRPWLRWLCRLKIAVDGFLTWTDFLYPAIPDAVSWLARQLRKAMWDSPFLVSLVIRCWLGSRAGESFIDWQTPHLVYWYPPLSSRPGNRPPIESLSGKFIQQFILDLTCFSPQATQLIPRINCRKNFIVVVCKCTSNAWVDGRMVIH